MATTATRHHHLAIAASAMALLAASPSRAVDGVLEINQACAVNTGCFSGDAGGFPVTIDGSAGRSYVLTGDLQVPDASTSGIEISANDVSVDLGGFSIRGATVCSGTPTTCSPLGSGLGVGVTMLDVQSTEVRNGTVMGMGASGVALGSSGRVERIRAFGNGGVGIGVSLGGTISGCIAVRNGSVGISGLGVIVIDSFAALNREEGINAGAGSTVTGNVSNGNFGTGIDVGVSPGASTAVRNSASSNAGVGIAGGNHTSLRGNHAHANDLGGIICGDNCTVGGNTILRNGSDGIRALDAANVFDNTVSENGDASGEDGVEVGDGSSVVRNVVRSNAHAGIRASVACTIADNTVTANGAPASGSGIVAAAGSRVSRNTVHGNEAWGLSAISFPVGYGDNVLTSNNQAGSFGEVSGLAVDLGGNLCSPTPCP